MGIWGPQKEWVACPSSSAEMQPDSSHTLNLHISGTVTPPIPSPEVFRPGTKIKQK